MSAAEHQSYELTNEFERCRRARDIIRAEAEALDRLSHQLPADFSAAVDSILACRSNLIISGIGKAGWIGQKLSATFASTGTPSHFLHPSEAMHGDLGRIRDDDIVLLLSNSGETEEILSLIPTFKKRELLLIAMTAGAGSCLARSADLLLDYRAPSEACALGLAPSTSTTVMLALGDALALVTSAARQFTTHDFAKFHPGGNLGRKLSLVQEVMRPLSTCRVARCEETVRAVYTRLRGPMRRSGAILVQNEHNRLAGIFTDSDLARLLEQARDDFFDQPICEVMTRSPITIAADAKTLLAVETLACHNISELPVVDRLQKPLGIVDVTDVIGLMNR